MPITVRLEICSRRSGSSKIFASFGNDRVAFGASTLVISGVG